MKKEKLLLVSSVVLLALSGCTLPAPSSSETYSDYDSGDHTGSGAIISDESSESVVTVNHSVDDVYDFLADMYNTKTFKQKIYGDTDIFNFIYKDKLYISQEGGGIDYSVVTLPEYHAGKSGRLAYFAPYEYRADGGRDYRLGNAVALYDMFTGQVVGQENNLLNYNPVSEYKSAKIKYTEIKDTDEENTFVMSYDERWYEQMTGFDSLYCYVCKLIEAGPYFSAGRVKSIEFKYIANETLRITGYLWDFDLEATRPYFISEISDVGDAEDPDLEAWLNSDKSKISSEALSESVASNLLTESFSSKTTVSADIDGNLVPVGVNNLDYDSEKMAAYGIGGDLFFHNVDGAVYRDYIDGQNGVSSMNTGFTWDVVNGIADDVDWDDFRKVANNKYRYYGPNLFEIFEDLSETTLPYGWNFESLYINTDGSKVTSLTAETDTLWAILEDGTEARVKYILDCEVVYNREMPVLRPYERDDATCEILENALEVLNGGKTEFSYFGKEWSDDTEFDALYPSNNKMTYTEDFIFQQKHGTRDKMGVGGVTLKVEEDIQTGYLRKYDGDGKVTGTQRFKVNRKGEYVSSHKFDAGRDYVENNWYYSDPAAEIFDFDPATKTFASKEGMGFQASIFTQKVYGYTANNFYHDVRFILNDDLSRITRVEYDCVYEDETGVYGRSYGAYDIDYNPDYSAVAAKLAELPEYHTPECWSESAVGEKIIDEFNAYYAGKVDCHGNPLDIDMIPYVYLEMADDYWAPLQFTIGNEFWLLNDWGGPAEAMQQIIEELRSNPDFTETGRTEWGGTTFVNGDLKVNVMETVMDGLWFGYAN